MAACLAFLVLSAGVSKVFYDLISGKPKITFAQLNPGVYKGEVTGVLASDYKYGLIVIKTRTQVYALLGKENCQFSIIDDRNSFNCGDLKFAAQISSLTEKNSVGTIRELSWGNQGSWTLSKVD